MPSVTSKWKPKNRKRRKQGSASETWLLRLAELERIRRPFAEVSSRLVRQAFDEWLPRGGPVIEVGTGSGQLRTWLEPSGDWLHTEPDAAALSHFRARFPEARCDRRGIEDLKTSDAHCSAVVGLCVLDLVEDIDAAFRELHRVLRPGGRIIHLVDLNPTPHAHFAELAHAKKIVLPNLFSDPTAAEWPEDLLAIEREPMFALLEALAARNHPLPHVFGRYMRRFAKEPFDATATAREFDAIARTPASRELLEKLLLSAYSAGHQLALPPPVGERLSSAQALASRLQRRAERHGFTVERNAMERASGASTTTEPGAPRCRRLVTGMETLSNELPEGAPLDQPAAQLLEVGMHLFVATKPS